MEDIIKMLKQEEDEWKTVEDAAKLIGCSRIAVYKLIERHPEIKRGTMRYYEVNMPLLRFYSESGMNKIKSMLMEELKGDTV